MANGRFDPDPEAPLAIAEGLDVVLLSDDEVLVQFGMRSHPSELLRDADLTGIIGKTITRLLEGPASTSDLLSAVSEEHRTELIRLVEDLVRHGILSELGRSPVEQYLRYTFSGESSTEHRSVTLIGAGPLGARIAQTLLQHGIGRLTVLDDRVTDRLWSAFMPRASGEANGSGRPAQDRLCEYLRSAGFGGVDCPDARLDAAGIEPAVVASDLTVVALEQPHVRLSHLINRLCVRHRRPWMLATIDGNRGLVGPLFWPVETACYNDYRTLAAAATPSHTMARAYHKYLLRRPASSFFCGLPSYADIIAGHTSLAVVHFLHQGTSFALGRVMVIDLERMVIDVEDVLKLPRCPVCGTERKPYRAAFQSDLVVSQQT